VTRSGVLVLLSDEDGAAQGVLHEFATGSAMSTGEWVFSGTMADGAGASLRPSAQEIRDFDG